MISRLALQVTHVESLPRDGRLPGGVWDFSPSHGFFITGPMRPEIFPPSFGVQPKVLACESPEGDHGLKLKGRISFF
jgi:hypothetical protein